MKETIKILVIIFAGSTMIAHGLRMITQGLFYSTSIYPVPIPTSINFWFDWFTLAMLGLAVFIMGIRSYYQVRKQQIKAFI